MSALCDRAASLFGEIAVAAGVFEATYGRRPTHLVIRQADAMLLVEYAKKSDDAVGYDPKGPIARTTRNACKRALVSELIPVVKPVRQIGVC